MTELQENLEKEKNYDDLIRHSADLHISLYIFTFSKRLIRKTFIIELNINKVISIRKKLIIVLTISF